ncbi:hypothetical protein [Oceanivirga salmonicida]|uniref:hypothetical protein n=1 Tax=Oceanivirga salmonicida TaxID=1769291 RepID=UPI00083600C7|nr:hypothetical protein [Oceanivirga salmonicida]
MKKIILFVCAFNSLLTFTSNFNTKINLEYNNTSLKERRANVGLIGVEFEYNAPIYKINDKLSLIITGGLDIKLGIGQANDKTLLYTHKN